MYSLPEREKIDQLAAIGFTKHVSLGRVEVSQTLELLIVSATYS